MNASASGNTSAATPYTPPPPPSLNGGLYTGEPFAPGAPWANVPATPDVSHMTAVNLKSARPPPGALTQFAGSIRPGNNYQEMPGVSMYSDKHSMLCSAPCTATASDAAPPRFARFYHM